jgi:hypothetical protein
MVALSDSPIADSTRRTLKSGLFRAFRAAYITAVIWCAGTLMTAWYVWTPGKGRPGSYFARDTFPTVLALSVCLFIVGALWSMISRQARESRSVKWSVVGAFAIMILAELCLLTGR